MDTSVTIGHYTTIPVSIIIVQHQSGHFIAALNLSCFFRERWLMMVSASLLIKSAIVLLNSATVQLFVAIRKVTAEP
jgi:hypothetical protein